MTGQETLFGIVDVWLTLEDLGQEESGFRLKFGAGDTERAE